MGQGALYKTLDQGMIYVPRPTYFLFLTLNNSQDPEERWKENTSGGQMGGQPADG